MKKFNVLKVALLLVVQALACFSQTAQLRWDTQLDRPVDHPLIIYRGETLDLLPRIVQGTDPVAITNQALYFRYREPALIASNLYREVAITTNAAPGTLQFTWTPELDILSPTYDYEFVVGSNPRVHGRITMRGTISYPASTNAPAPSTRWLTDLDLAAATASLATTSDLAAVASDLQSTSNSLAASINDVQAYSETKRTDKLWNGENTYMDGDGVMWEIWPSVVYTSFDPGPFTGVAFNLTAVADNQYYYYAENNALLKWYSGYWSLFSENGQLIASGRGGPTDSVVDLSGGANFTFERNESGFTTNIVDRVVTTNDNIIIVGQTKDSMGLTTNLQAKTGETEINISFAGWKDILSVIDEIPPVEFPQNAVTGWLLYDTGSNIWLRVNVSNLSFTVHEVLP